MSITNSFTAESAQGAAAVCIPNLPLSGREFATFFPKKEFFPKFFLPLLRLLHIILTGEFKQKTSLATYECSFRKGELHIASDMWKTALRVAFLFILTL